MKKHPVLLVTKAMLQGHMIEIGEHQYQIKDEALLVRHQSSAKIDLGMDEHKWEPCWFGSDMTLTQWIAEVNKIPQEELYVIAGNVALTEINRGE